MPRRALPLTAIAAGLLLAGPVLASHVQPEFVSGASSCGPLVPGTVELVVEVPQELAGEVTDGDFTAAVVLDGSVGNGSVRFEDASLPVKAAFVAGVDGGNLYTYEEPVRADDGLVAPEGEPISGVSFCYVTEGEDEGTSDEGSDGEGDGAGDGGQEGDAAGGAEDGEDRPPPATDTVAPAMAAWPSILLIAAGLTLVGLGVVSFRLGAAPVASSRARGSRAAPRRR